MQAHNSAMGIHRKINAHTHTLSPRDKPWQHVVRGILPSESSKMKAPLRFKHLGERSL